MATLTGNSIASTYKDLLQVSNSNAGVDATLRTVDDGEGTASALSISSAAIQVDNIKIDGNTITSEDTNGNITLTPNGTGDVEVSTGNLVIGTAGKGISFAATSDAGGMTSELLDDYEEGTWTPAPNAGSWTVGNAIYTKVGRLVKVSMHCSGFTTSGSDTFTISGLPFDQSANHNVGSAILSGFNRSGVSNYEVVYSTTTTIKVLVSLDSGGGWDSLLQSQIATGSSMMLSYSYIV